MTFSEAWIEAGADSDFASFLNRTPRLCLLPPPPSLYWIGHVKEWAKNELLPIEHPAHGIVRVKANKRQLQQFLTKILGQHTDINDPTTLLGYIWQHWDDDRVYEISAEEF